MLAATLYRFAQPLLVFHAALAAPNRRSRRVSLLLAVVVVLSVADLIITLGFMGTVGMLEANPIVVHVARWTGSIAAIALCKCLSVSIAVLLLHALRRHPQAELGAWVAVIVLIWLSVQWVRYAGTVAELDLAAMMRFNASDPAWVVFN